MTSVLILSDMHIGSTVSLCKPSVTLDDGGEYRASKRQAWLWNSWNDMLDRVQKRKDGDLYIIINGDAVEGDIKNRSFQTISRNPATILNLAIDILEPLARSATGLFFVRGTDAHTGKSSNLEEKLAQDLGAVKTEDNAASSWFYLPLEVEGIRFDIAHHPGIGVSRNPWTGFNGINNLAARVLFEYADAGRPIPHLVIRSHNHIYRDSKDNYQHIRAITTPAWTMPTEYIHRIAPGALADIGAVLVNCSAGYYEVEVMRYKPAPSPVFDVKEIAHDTIRE